MKPWPGRLLSPLAGLAFLASAFAAPMPEDASTPIPKTGDPVFFQKHEGFLAWARRGPMGVLFLGDSITEGWVLVPQLWENHFGRYQPANFGSSGDRTQHVLWRIKQGELDGISPKVVVLLLGTNNSGEHTGAQIAAADKKIVGLIRKKLPHAKILLLAIFPRGPRLDNTGRPEDWMERRAAINAANAELARLDDGRTIRFLDINDRFLDQNGSIPELLMPDQLHLSPAGYQVWAEAIEQPLAEMMK